MRDRASCCIGSNWACQMMAFIEYQEPKLATQLRRMDASAGISSYAYRSDHAVLIADDSRINAQSSEDSSVPLVHQISHWGDDQGWDRALGDDRESHFGLSCSGGHDDDPTFGS